MHESFTSPDAMNESFMTAEARHPAEAPLRPGAPRAVVPGGAPPHPTSPEPRPSLGGDPESSLSAPTDNTGPEQRVVHSPTDLWTTPQPSEAASSTNVRAAKPVAPGTTSS